MIWKNESEILDSVEPLSPGTRLMGRPAIPIRSGAGDGKVQRVEQGMDSRPPGPPISSGAAFDPEQNEIPGTIIDRRTNRWYKKPKFS